MRIFKRHKQGNPGSRCRCGVEVPYPVVVHLPVVSVTYWVCTACAAEVLAPVLACRVGV
jgi:hypothetical protein